MRKLLIISGPTASEKTSLAFSLATKFNGELISADSRQVYRGMDIITSKEIDKEIKTWLLDVVEPNEDFNVSDFYQLAWEAINDICKRGKLPIVVGGTGFYIRAVIDGIGTMGIPPDWELRRKLEKLTVKQLQKRLQEVDKQRWEKMNKSDQHNPRRLIRAIEIHLGGVVSQHPRGGRMDSSGVDVLWVGLTTDFKTLYERIDERVDERIKMGGLEETKQLAKKFGWDVYPMTGQGYRELRGFLEGKISLEEAVKQWKFAEHKYARKQMTWFRKEKRIIWFDIAERGFQEKVEKKVQAWYIGS